MAVAAKPPHAAESDKQNPLPREPVAVNAVPPGSAGNRLPSALYARAAWIADHTRSGVAGMSMPGMP